ncbi:MAG: GMC oxidoreductase [Pseudomonadota bacterium]
MFVSFQEVNLSRYDVIIAGSGPAGAVTAKTLAARGKTVLVLESGVREIEPTIQDSFSVVHGLGHFDSGYWPTHWVRALGGTSAVWSGWVAPLSARNFASWPITREDLDPWYDIAARELGRPELINTWEAPSVPGFDMRPFSRHEPNRYGDEAGTEIWEHERVHVLLNATLARVHPRPDRRGISAITVYVAPDVTTELPLSENQSIVLAAGGMGNAQILLGSDDGTGAAVGNEFDQVGRYLMEHPHLYHCANMVVRAGYGFPEPPAGFGGFTPALVPDDAMFEANGGIDASFQLSPDDTNADDAIERFVVERLGGQADVYSLSARTEMVADPGNRVERVFGTDPSGLPRIRATCVVGADDYRSVLGYLRRMGDALARENLGRIRINNDVIFNDLTGGGHTVGTTRMGDNPRTSVTDADCRVHGYANLFVAGSSLFTTGGYANPTMTIVALAARLGDYLGGQA